MSVLSAVHHTPAELLCEIFYWTSPHDCIRTVHAKEVPTAPWWLTHICHDWRTVAHGYGGALSLCYPLAALEAQLALSAEVPLDVSFSSGLYPQPTDVIALLQALVHHSNRWERFFFSTSGMPSVLAALSGVRGNIALLHHLNLATHSDEWPTELRDIFAAAPQLREVLFLRPPVISIPWHQLTQLWVESESEFLLQNLRKAPNLIDCDLTVLRGAGISHTDTIVVLPNLRKLVVQNSWIARFLEASNLESLEVRGNFDEVPGFLRRSECHLQTLELSYCMSQSAVFIDLLRQVPTLRHLELDFDRDDVLLPEEDRGLIPQYLLAMKATSESYLCPKLTSINVGFPPNQTAAGDYEALCDMMESRWNASPSLIDVSLYPITVPLSVWDRLKAMRNAKQAEIRQRGSGAD
ncbi:hypothetical protein K438DRAFT_1865707 [Mycena galopus ATCC 62051]|nr:hypothetical protein K438DRAFT_1865707 [Mycena galopus ATCC 62051]